MTAVRPSVIRWRFARSGGVCVLARARRARGAPAHADQRGEHVPHVALSAALAAQRRARAQRADRARSRSDGAWISVASSRSRRPSSDRRARTAPSTDRGVGFAESIRSSRGGLVEQHPIGVSLTTVRGCGGIPRIALAMLCCCVACANATRSLSSGSCRCRTRRSERGRSGSRPPTAPGLPAARSAAIAGCSATNAASMITGGVRSGMAAAASTASSRALESAVGSGLVGDAPASRLARSRGIGREHALLRWRRSPTSPSWRRGTSPLRLVLDDRVLERLARVRAGRRWRYGARLLRPAASGA